MTAHRQWIEGATIHGSVIQAREIRAVHLGAERALYAVESFPLTRPAISDTWVRQQPARLLDARYALVDFTGRHDELARLAAWRDGPDQVSALLVHGPGGQGKSRIAAQFARSSHTDGWRVLQARHATAGLLSPSVPITGRADGGTGVLMVVDYAERWPTADLIELLLDAVRQGGRVRVLLVARPRGTWWQHLAHRLGDFDIPVSDLALPGLSDDAGVSPQTLFRTARDCFAQALGVADAHAVGPPDGLSADPEYRQVLAVHMAALAAVDSHRRGRAAPDGAAAVSAYLLARERAHWETLHANKRVLITPDAFGQVVYTAAMTSALSHREALGVLARIGVGSSEHADQILKDHALSYPAEEGGTGGTVLEPLYPDRLAEDFLALSVAGHGIDGYAPDPWASDAPRRLLDGESPPCLRRVLARLVATAARWPHVRSAQLRPLLLERPELGVAAGGATLAALSEIVDLDPDVLEAIEAHLPDGSHTDLNSGAAALAQRLVGHRLARTHDPEDQARLLNALAQRQSHAGLHDQALKSGQRAMEIRRSMSAAHTDTGEPSFAVVLCDVGVYLAKDGQFADALAATDQAVRLLRGLRDEQPGRHDDALAVALSNYAADLATEGHWAEALDTVQEAVEIRRRLAVAADRSTSAVADGPTASAVAAGPTASAVAAGPTASAAQRAPLAAALANLAICLSRAGRREEACAAAEDAVAIQRDLARTNPHTHEPALASALVNLSRRLTHVSRHTHAREAAHEAVAVLRRLAHVNPAAYEEDLAVALLNLGACLAPLNHRAETCRVLEETAAIRRRLAARNPRQYEPALAASLESLGLASFRAGRHNRAFVAWSEAIELRGRFAAAGGEREQADLAGLLCTVAWMHLAQGRELPRALKVIEEAVELLWPLARKPGPLGARLVEAVDIHARVLTALDHPAEAAEVRRRLMRFQRGDLDHGGGPAATTHGVGDWNGSS
ncbi:hypothetical protein [Streptomyces lasiicapitis]|uniref:hypothetical protein n=1 Tax=Streptomyces lasiicapitis TaxID=1923961 RepID=UPI0036834EF2